VLYCALSTIKSYITATFGKINRPTRKKKIGNIFGNKLKLYNLTTITIFVPGENEADFIP
jgi:hypothetical protein